jgi:hypothetical protein
VLDLLVMRCLQNHPPFNRASYRAPSFCDYTFSDDPIARAIEIFLRSSSGALDTPVHGEAQHNWAEDVLLDAIERKYGSS